MKDLIDAKTWEAVEHYGGAATVAFYQHLRERRFMSTECARCKEISFPPRTFCSACASREIAWVELPRRGTLYAFTTQQRSLRFSAPDVIGLVELPGVGRILSRIDAPLSSLSIGREVELDFLEISDRLVVHQFRPA